MVPNALIASDLGKELYPPILITLVIHVFQVKIEIERVVVAPFSVDDSFPEDEETA